MSRKEQWLGVNNAGCPRAGRCSAPSTRTREKKKSVRHSRAQSATTASIARRRLRSNKNDQAEATARSGYATQRDSTLSTRKKTE